MIRLKLVGSPDQLRRSRSFVCQLGKVELHDSDRVVRGVPVRIAYAQAEVFSSLDGLRGDKDWCATGQLAVKYPNM
jgi:hypothetical protein